MREVIRYNNQEMEFWHTDENEIKRGWRQGDKIRSWTSEGVATIFAKRVVSERNGVPIETFYLAQRPRGLIRTYNRRYRLIGISDEKNFLGRAMQICPAGRSFFPPELPQILDFVEQNWGWTVDPEIRNLLVQARS